MANRKSAPSTPSTAPAPKDPAREELQRSLERLHEELAASPRVDAQSRALLREVLADIHRLLSTPTDHQSRQVMESAPRRLTDLAVVFEARHPVLAASVREFVDLLGRAGL